MDRLSFYSIFKFSRIHFPGFLGLCALSFIFSPSLTARAADLAYPALEVCDPDFYKTLENKAWMETQREIQVNQTVITKPASTLALSCFDQQINQAASAGGAFSDVSNANASKGAINTAIGTSFTDYYAQNFTDPPIFAGTTFNSQGNFNGACDRLNQMWASMKCGVSDPTLNYLKPLDYFRSSAASGKDIRDATGLAKCGTTASSALAGIYTNNMQETTDLSAHAATYFDKASPDFCAYNPKTGSDALGDSPICTIKTANGSTQEKKCSEMNAVPTGVLVQYTSDISSGSNQSTEKGAQYWSYACLNPGCYFDVKANASRIKFSPSTKTAPSGLKCSAKP